MIGTLENKPTLPTVHVYPVNDTRRHKLDASGTCWCKPAITEYEDCGKRVTHNSADEREFIEANLGELLDEDKKWELKEIG